MSDRGSSTVVALAVVSLLMLAAVGFAATGRYLAAHTQATAAADAAALAAAPLTFLGGGPEAEADDYAHRNGARLVSCACEPDPSLHPRVVTVEVVIPVDLGPFGTRVVHARSAAEFAPLDLLGASIP